MGLFRRDRKVEGIAKDTLDFILHACRSTHPHEFIGILRAENSIISDVLVIPGTTSNHVSATLQLHMLPLASGDVGTVHSHPSGSTKPSNADLHMFSNRGEWHIIVGHPYTQRRTRCYDGQGQPRDLPILDVDLDEEEDQL